MEIQYDEDLSLNKFFQKVQCDHKILIETAPLENWIICVPRSGVLKPEHRDNTDFLLAHILVPHDEIDEHYTNLLGHDVKQINKTLLTPTHESMILFEEIFYTRGLFKYIVWCVDSPLLCTEKNQLDENEKSPKGLFIISGLTDAVALIWNETKSKAILKKIENICCTFMKNTNCTSNLLIDPNLFVNDDNNFSRHQKNLNRIKTSVEILLNYCYKKLLIQKSLHEKCIRDLHFQRVFKIALETYVMDILYRWLFDAVTLCYANLNEEFNRIVRNLSDMNLKDFNIDTNQLDVIGCVRVELLKINNVTTPIEKMSCLRQALSIASQRKIHDLSVDDLIPILAFVIIKSGLTHWITTSYYLKSFIFTEFTDNSDKGVDSFILTTLEAAILFIQSMPSIICFENTPSMCSETKKNVRYFDTKEHFTEYLFERIRSEDVEEIKRLLKVSDKSMEITIDCDNIIKYFDDTDDSGIVIKLIDNSETFIDEDVANDCDLNHDQLNIQNKNGIGAIHVAAMNGLTKIVNILLPLGVDQHILDENNWTPLHYAAAKGRQSTLLLLLNSGANINALTVDGNSPLHLSALNGHTSCVKALLFFAEHQKKNIERNGQNRIGDTPLHLASKWGFQEIVNILLEYGVKVEIENRYGQRPIDCAHNTYIAVAIQNAFIVIDSGDLYERSRSSSSLALSQEFHGCFTSSISSLIDDEVFTNKTPNDKIVAAIRNGDLKLAYHFLGIEIDENIPCSTCHPLCDCTECIKIITQRNNSNTSVRIYDGNINELSIDGTTPLHVAFQMKNYEMIEELFKLGATVNPQMRTTKQTALHLAITVRSPTILDLVLTHINDGDIDIQDENGDSALHLAVKLGDIQAVEALMKHEPNIRLWNNDAKTSIDIAKSSLQVNIVHLLESIDLSTE